MEPRGTWGRGYAGRCKDLEAMDRNLTSTRRRALEMIAGTPNGCSEAVLRTHGFGVMLLAGLMWAGFANADVETTQAGGRVRMRITDAGKRALAG
jgi:hypothetical protein